MTTVFIESNNKIDKDCNKTKTEQTGQQKPQTLKMNTNVTVMFNHVCY